MEKRIFWAGDSTVAKNTIMTYPQTGMGQGLELYVKEKTCIYNYAMNGRSTKSFINEGRLDKIENEIKENDFLFIQFGHNDAKDDEERHTDPFTTYKQYLLHYINVARKKNSHPLLITPVYRRYFDENGTIKDNVHMQYPEAMIELAKKEDIPYIDLCQMSKDLLQEKGDEKSKLLFMHIPKNICGNYPNGIVDDTHLNYEGAIIMAGLIAKGLKNIGNVYGSLILDDYGR